MSWLPCPRTNSRIVGRCLVALALAAAIRASFGPEPTTVLPAGIATATDADALGPRTGGAAQRASIGPRLVRPPLPNRSNVGPSPALVAAAQWRDLAARSVGGVWQEIGPVPESTGNEFPFQAATGRVLHLASAGGSTLLAATAGGGVWKSTNGGGSWSPLTDAMPDLASNTVTVDPNNQSVIYAGTGEISEFEDSLRGVGIYKSTDGGANWVIQASSLYSEHDISSIVVDPTNSMRVYAGVMHPFTVANQGVGVSLDGGQTWTVTLAGKDVSDLLVDQAGRLYAAVKGEGVYVSANQGTSWSSMSVGLPGAAGSMYKIAMAPNTAGSAPSAQILYAATSDASTGQLLGVYRTVNGGTSWTQIGSENAWPGATGGSDSHLTIGVDPGDATGGTVYVGSIDVLRSNNALSGSPSWVNVTNPGGATNTTKIHLDQYSFLWVPNGSGFTMYVGNDGGVYRTTDSGGTWTAAQGNLGIIEYYGGALGPTSSPSLVVGGSQDNGTIKSTGSSWTSAVGGDHFYVAIDPTNVNLMYTDDPYGKPIKSTNGLTVGPGLYSWQFAANGLPAPDVYGNIDHARFHAPLVMDPTNPSVLYSAHEHVWQTTDAMNSWHNISAGVSTAGLTAVAISKSNPSTLYIADAWDHRAADPNDYRTHLWKTTNGGSTWASIDGTACTAANQSPRWCSPVVSSTTSLAVDPTDAAVVYATVDGANPSSGNPVADQRGHVFRSVDGGNTWSDISTSLPNMPYHSIVVAPNTHTTLYLGGALGVYVSFDSGTSWQVLGSGLPNASVYHLVPAADGSYVVAFTFGRGAWKIPTLAPTPARVSGFRVVHQGSRALLRWRVPVAHGIAGFDVFAGPYRLNAHLLVVHRPRQYSFRTAWRPGGYRLRVTLRNGQQYFIAPT